jgi:uncharacterized membrane protein
MEKALKKQPNWLVVWNILILFPIILGMSSSQLTKSIHQFSEGEVETSNKKLLIRRIREQPIS